MSHLTNEFDVRSQLQGQVILAAVNQINNKYIEIIHNLGETILYLIFYRINSFVEVQNGKAEQPVRTRTAKGANKKLVLHVRLRYGSLSITTQVSHLTNEFDVRSQLQGQVDLAAVNQILCRS